MERIPFSQRVADLPVKKIKMWNLILAGLSILFSMVLTSVVIADKFQLFKVSSSALKWTATGLILFIVVGVSTMKKVSKWIKKLEYSDFRQFILFIVSLIPLLILTIIVGLLKNHTIQTMNCIEYIIAFFAVDKLVLYFKSFFEYEIEIIKKAKEAERVDRRRENL